MFVYVEEAILQGFFPLLRSYVDKKCSFENFKDQFIDLICEFQDYIQQKPIQTHLITISGYLDDYDPELKDVVPNSGALDSDDVYRKTVKSYELLLPLFSKLAEEKTYTPLPTPEEKANVLYGEYVPLIRSFVGKRITAKSFERLYLSLHSGKNNFLDMDAVADIMSDIFCDVDEYCSDDELRPHVKLAIDCDELYRRTLVNYNKLCTLLNLESKSD